MGELGPNDESGSLHALMPWLMMDYVAYGA